MHEVLNKSEQTHPLLRTQTLRRIEANALGALAEGTLMSRAADAICDMADRSLRELPSGRPVLVLVGPGDNGADALLAAIGLRERGYPVVAYSSSDAAPISNDARRVHEAWAAQGQGLRAIRELDSTALAAGVLVLDGLFGIGLARAIVGETAAAIARLNASGLRVIALDMPSGIDADRGSVVGGSNGIAVRAAMTVTMIADKPGLRTGVGREYAGQVVLAPIGVGIPRLDGLLIGRDWVSGHVRARRIDSHKGSYGTAMLIGGSTGMHGALMLAARAAQAAGAGKVIAASTDHLPSDPLAPQLMGRRLASRPGAGLPFDTVSALGLGCGLGQSPAAAAWLAAALGAELPLVIDADGLNLIAARTELASALRARAPELPSILTPHPLEAGRLLGLKTPEVQADRIGAACRLAAQSGATVVLKGAGSIIADPAGNWSIIDSGGPALATGGTGDVLAGVVVAMLCAGLNARESAICAAWLHGAAGDRWSASHRRHIGLPCNKLPEMIMEQINALD